MNSTTISKWGNSLGLRIPKAVIDAHGLQDGDTITIESEGTAIILQKKRTIKKHELADILGSFHTTDEVSEIDWGKPQGNEIW